MNDPFARRRAELEVLEIEHEVVARFDDNAWVLLCGKEECGHEFAVCSWLDVQFYMILNSTDEAAAQRALKRLPSPERRTYRLCVEFGPSWRKHDDGIWRESRAVRRAKRAGSWDPLAQRIIRGRLSSASLGQEADPPVYAECPDCSAVNLVEREHRVGIPGYQG